MIFKNHLNFEEDELFLIKENKKKQGEDHLKELL